MGKTRRREKTDNYQRLKKDHKDNIRKKRRDKERIKNLYLNNPPPEANAGWEDLEYELGDDG